jgi:hypothetical protein
MDVIPSPFDGINIPRLSAEGHTARPAMCGRADFPGAAAVAVAVIAVTAIRSPSSAT